MELAEERPLSSRKCPPKQMAARFGMGHEKIAWKDYGPAGWPVITSIKRRKVLRSLSLRYHCLGENVLKETYQIPLHTHPRENGRQQYGKARETLRLTDELAFDMEPGALRRCLDDIYLHRREHVSPNLPETQPVSVEIRPSK